MSAVVSPIREPLIEGGKTYRQITEDICSPTEKAPNLAWIIAFGISSALLGLYLFTVAWTIWFGIGTWNLNRTIGWGWDITNFVWWVGIGHSLVVPSALAHGGKPGSGGHDHFRGDVCGSIPAHPHGSSLAGNFHCPLPQHARSALG